MKIHGTAAVAHCDEIVAYIGAPLALFDLELPADVDHNEPQTDVEQRVGRGLEARIGCAQCAGKQLRGDEAQHQEERERKNFSPLNDGRLRGFARRQRRKDTIFAPETEKGVPQS